MQVLAISGSLRQASINTAFCRAVQSLAPAGLEVVVYTGLGSLALFNPDLEPDPPSSVLALRRAIGQANIVLIASPEYAHGITGAMKNALDWLVSFEGFVDKPVALINTSPRAQHAYAATLETLKTMSADILSDCSISLPLLAHCSTQEAMLDSPEISHTIRSLLQSLAHVARTRSGPICL